MEVYECSEAKTILSKVTNFDMGFRSLTTYGTCKDPLYLVGDIERILESHLAQKVRGWDDMEAVMVKINGRQRRVLTRHGLVRATFEAKTPIGTLFRRFVYEVLDKLFMDGSVELKDVQAAMEEKYKKELEAAKQQYQRAIATHESEVNLLTNTIQQQRIINEELEVQIHETIDINKALIDKQSQLEKTIDQIDSKDFDELCRSVGKPIYVYAAGSQYEITDRRRQTVAQETLYIKQGSWKEIKEEMSAFCVKGNRYDISLDLVKDICTQTFLK
jgi:hypothetical protein